jgi:hypothetical protein
MVFARPLSAIDAFAATRVLALGVCAGLCSGAVSAAELSREKLSSSSDVAHCAVYGPGYVRVDGSYACARIGERMRVEMRVNRAPPFLGGFTPTDDFAVDGPSDSAWRAHLRLDRSSTTDHTISR